jgi:purine-binding chemotaxis protein CheW
MADPRQLPFATESTYHAYRRAEGRAGAWQREVLAFIIGSEEYAVDIRRIREIIKPREATEVPRAPSFVLGIISVRGIIIPLIDLRRRLRLDPALWPPTRDARILIVTRAEESFGLFVDEVRQVVRMRDSEIEPPPAMLGGQDSEFIAGIGRPYRDRLLILLELDAVLTFSTGGRP